MTIHKFIFDIRLYAKEIDRNVYDCNKQQQNKKNKKSVSSLNEYSKWPN